IIDGRLHQLPLNEGGHTHLHGGRNGFGHRLWTLVAHDAESVTLALDSPDGDEGYPGHVRTICRYVAEAPGTIRFEAEATTDRPTVVNLAQHSYFNLDDSADILDHEVTIFADAWTPTDEDSIPTGAILPVAGSVFDFRTPKPIRQMQDGERVVFDKNFVVARERAAAPRPHARLSSRKSGVVLD